MSYIDRLQDGLAADAAEQRRLRREVAELKRRIRLAREVFDGRRVMREACDDGSSFLVPKSAALGDLLDLRKPLTKRGSR